MDYGIFREKDGHARREVIELFRDWECSDPEYLAGQRLEKEYKEAKRKYENVVMYPEADGFTVFRPFYAPMRIFIDKGIFDYE